MSEGRKNVLVIEPDPRVRTIFRDLLRRRNVRVWTGATLTEALRQVRKRRFACLIIDADMEGPKGNDALERLRLIDPAVKLLLVSRRPGKPPPETSDDRTFFCHVDTERLRSEERPGLDPDQHVQGTGSNESFGAPHTGQTQSSGSASNGLPSFFSS